MNKGVDREQMGSYNEFEQMIKERCISDILSDDVADALRMFAQATVDTVDMLKRFEELCSIQIEEGKRNCNTGTKKEALQELSGIKTNKQKVEHIKVQTRKEKELVTSVYKTLH